MSLFTLADTADACSVAFKIQEDLNLQAKGILHSGTRAMTGHLNMGTHHNNNMADPSNPKDAATKAYVDHIWFKTATGILPYATDIDIPLLTFPNKKKHH